MKARTRAKVDGNQVAIVKYLRHCGASIQHMHQISGALDLIVGFAGIDQRVEIKDPAKPPSKRKLTDDEQKVFDEWQGRPPIVLETEADCVRMLADMMADRQRLKVRD